MKRKIRKFRGGGADMGAPERAQERANRGYGSTAGVDRSAVGPGSKFAENTNTQNLNTNKKSSNIPIVGPISLGINLVKKFFDRPKKNKHPFSANTIKQTKKPPMPPMGGDNNRPQLCPDGTMPPCKTTTAATQATKPTNTFLQNFKAYNSGGVSSGPPPLRGPNPQVPPVKMRNGKMTNKYKMSCPHRPDGIRGMGAAIKGHKFIGVK